MAKSKRKPANQQYQDVLKARDKVNSFLQQEGVANAGVGFGFDRDTQSWRLAIHLESPLPPEITQFLQSSWPETEVRVVGPMILY
jgi:hypothetical protein